MIQLLNYWFGSWILVAGYIIAMIMFFLIVGRDYLKSKQGLRQDRLGKEGAC